MEDISNGSKTLKKEIFENKFTIKKFRSETASHARLLSIIFRTIIKPGFVINDPNKELFLRLPMRKFISVLFQFIFVLWVMRSCYPR